MDRILDIGQAVIRHARDGLTPTALPGVSVIRHSETSQPLGDVVQPAFALIAGGRKSTTVNGEVYKYGAGEYLVSSVALPVVGNVDTASEDEPFLAVVIDLNPDRIASLLFDTGVPTASPTESKSAFGVGQASPPLLDAIGRLLALLDEPADVPALFAGIEREVLWRLIQGPQGATIRQIGIADSRVSRLARSIRWIQDHYEQSLRTSDLAATAMMSSSSFHRHFLAMTSLTPLEYQKQLRLNDAHMRLLAGDREVADVGFSVGYSSPSQFSREYRRMFGTAPSQTLGNAAVL